MNPRALVFFACAFPLLAPAQTGTQRYDLARFSITLPRDWVVHNSVRARIDNKQLKRPWTKEDYDQLAANIRMIGPQVPVHLFAVPSSERPSQGFVRNLNVLVFDRPDNTLAKHEQAVRAESKQLDPKSNVAVKTIGRNRWIKVFANLKSGEEQLVITQYHAVKGRYTFSFTFTSQGAGSSPFFADAERLMQSVRLN